jgi:hypothetical protein
MRDDSIPHMAKKETQRGRGRLTGGCAVCCVLCAVCCVLCAVCCVLGVVCVSVPVNQPDPSGSLPLSLALWSHRIDMADVILSKGQGASLAGVHFAAYRMPLGSDEQGLVTLDWLAKHGYAHPHSITP